MLNSLVGSQGCAGGANPIAKLVDGMGNPQQAPMQHASLASAEELYFSMGDAALASMMHNQQELHPSVSSSSTIQSQPSMQLGQHQPLFQHNALLHGPMMGLPMQMPMASLHMTPFAMHAHQQGLQNLRVQALNLGAPVLNSQFQAFGDAASFEEKKAQSKFYKFLEMKERGDIMLHEGEVYERQSDGTWPSEAIDAMSQKVADTPQDDIFETDYFTNYQSGLEKLWSYSHTPNKYTFEENNTYTSHADPFNEGLALLNAGNLSEAALCFEAAVTQDPKHVLAWQYLGTTQASNERDPIALGALRECLALDPNNLVALMAQAVSFVNENMLTQALESLKKWLNVKYPAVQGRPADEVEEEETELLDVFLFDPRLYHSVVRLFEDAVVQHPEDVDVHVGAGVAFHLAKQYNRSTEHFQAALRLKPTDYKLWNKLGATLSNDKHYEEAIVAYERALELSPGFVRAQFNIGVAHSNVRRYHQAATHFLRALSMQQGCTDKSGTQFSQEIWEMVRDCLMKMNRPDLLQKLASPSLDDFRDEFAF